VLRVHRVDLAIRHGAVEARRDEELRKPIHCAVEPAHANLIEIHGHLLVRVCIGHTVMLREEIVEVTLVRVLCIS